MIKLFAQQPFKILDVSGKVNITSCGKTEALLKNHLIKKDFSLKLYDKSKVLILHTSGNTITLSGPVSINSAELKAKFAKKPSSLNAKYSDFILNTTNEPDDEYSVNYEDEDSGEFKSKPVTFDTDDTPLLVFNQLYQEAGDKSSCARSKGQAVMLANKKAALYHGYVYFAIPKSGKARVVLTNLFDEVIFEQTTSSNFVKIDISKFDLKEDLLLLDVTDAEVEDDDPGKTKLLVEFHDLNNESSAINPKEINELIESAGTAFDYLCIGQVFMSHNCPFDAHFYFQKAMEMEPKMAFYKNFVYRVYKKMILNKMPRLRKPVIYLYPEKTTEVQVKLDYSGELTVTYPQYPAEGWNVLATPEGKITDPNTERTYDYLYWEGRQNQHLGHLLAKDEGYMIRGANTISFLEEVLPQYGLNNSEMNDFITYWLPDMVENEYNHIRFLVGDECNELAGLNITPQPTSTQRLYMIYKASDGSTTLKTPGIQPFERKGFTVVEWGGIDLTERKQEVVYLRK